MWRIANLPLLPTPCVTNYPLILLRDFSNTCILSFYTCEIIKLPQQSFFHANMASRFQDATVKDVSFMVHVSWTRKSHSSATTGKEVRSLARSLWCRSNIAARLCSQLCWKFWSSSSILITSILCLERSCSEGSGPNDNLGVGLVSKSSKVMLADPDLTPVITNDFSH